MGFDARYRNHCTDEELATISGTEQRILLTRDIGLLKRRVVTYGYWLRGQKPKQQLREVLQRFTLFSHIRPWQRCLRCNGNIVPVDKEKVYSRLPPKTRQYYEQFSICQECQQVYWKGAHYSNLQQLITQISQ